jgi:hypothetical protein
MEIKFKWFDFWIGFYYDRIKKILYICPVPMIVFVIPLSRKDKDVQCLFCRYIRANGDGFYKCTKRSTPKNIITVDPYVPEPCRVFKNKEE